MAFVISAALMAINELNESENIRRKMLRDSSSPLDLPEKVFIECFRVNKEIFSWILEKICPRLGSTSIPLSIQLAATLRFFAEGSSQRSVANDAIIGMHRTTFTKSFKKMLVVLEEVLCTHWIKVQTYPQEILKSKRHFYQKFKIPGVVGCIDGTHVELVKPAEYHLYRNRKGFYSINALIICDFNMNIMAVDATKPGSSHDSFIWNISVIKDFYLSRHENGERGSWLLGDSGYALEPFVLTPYRSPDQGSTQHRFNQAHACARNIIERTIGVLKSRFRCLSHILWYKPPKVVKIINICSALHNMCNFYKIEHRLTIINSTIEEPDEEDDEIEDNNLLVNETIRNRDSIAQNLLSI